MIRILNSFFIQPKEFTRLHAGMFISVLLVETFNNTVFKNGWKKKLNISLAQAGLIQIITPVPFRSMVANVAAAGYKLFVYTMKPVVHWDGNFAEQNIASKGYILFVKYFFNPKTSYINYRLLSAGLELHNIASKAFCCLSTGRVVEQLYSGRTTGKVNLVVSGILLALTVYNLLAPLRKEEQK
jgi:hypothetical protein